jgi:hypothetical protein
MPNRLAVDVIDKIITEAAELLLKSADYLDDINSSLMKNENHIDVYYAIDADILSLYMEPNIGKNYLDIFTNQEKKITSIYLGMLLGDFLFVEKYKLLPNQEHNIRFLIIPPHDEEIIRNISAIYNELRQNISNSTENKFDRLTRLFEEYSIDNDDERLIGQLTECVPDLVELFNPYRGPKAALIRYGSLPINTLQRIDQYNHNGFSFPLVNPYDDTQLSERHFLENYEIEWEQIIKENCYENKINYLVKNDAKVLATLQYLNEKLRGEQKKVVLITGSQSIINAAKTVTTNGPLTFANEYIRHPLEFLIHKDMFNINGEEAASFRILEWLNLLFPNGINKEDMQYTIERSNLENVIKKLKNNESGSRGKNSIAIDTMVKIGKDPEFFVDEWESQISNIAKFRYSGGLDKADEYGAKKLANILTILKTNQQWSVENLKKHIINETVLSVSELYSKTVWIGLWSSVGRKQCKEIPILRFGDNQLEEYCDELVQMQIKSIHSFLSIEDMERIHDVCQSVAEIDPSQYLLHVFHALAFTVKGHWQPALILLETALGICEQLPENERGHRKGREAAYLASIVTRRFFRTKESLEKAKEYLNIAITNDDDPSNKDIRFIAEEILLKVKKCYFDVFMGDNSEFLRSYNEVLKEIEDLIFGISNDVTVLRIKDWVLRELIIGYLSLTLIVMIRVDTNWMDNEKGNNTIREYIQSVRDILVKENQNHFTRKDDPYTYLLIDVCTSIWGMDNDDESRRIAFEGIKNWEANYMPYDYQRIQLFKQCLNSEFSRKER